MDFELLVMQYWSIMLEFLLELYIFYFLIQFRLRRKPMYYLRFFGGLGVMSAIAFALTFAYHFYGDTIWGRTLIYLAVFGLSLLHVKLCYDETIWSVLFCCVCAYAAQNLAYKLQLVIWYTLNETGVFPRMLGTTEEIAMLIYRIYYISVMAVMYALIYFVLLRRIINNLNLSSAKWNILIISIFLLLVTVLLCTIEDIFVDQLSYLLRQTSNLFSIICCSCILLLLSGIIEKKSLTNEIEFLQHTMKRKEDQYKISKDTIEVINIKCHDMRHRLDLLREQGGNISSKEFSDLEEAISIYDSNIRTGNDTLDVILTDKNLFCEKHGINLSCMADGKNLSLLSESDIYGLFGNIIENAIEAVMALDDKSQRSINLIVKTKSDLLVIQSENFFDGKLQFDNGDPVTTKPDRNYHGFGIKSIKYIVHRYGGEVSFWADGNIFRLSIIFPLKPPTA